MLFRHTFIFTDRILESIHPRVAGSVNRTIDGTNADEATNPTNLTIGIHSRHNNPEKDGSDISREVACIDMIFEEMGYNASLGNEHCSIYVMSDRRATLENIIEPSQNRMCDTIEVEHLQKTEGAREEHGPFAGAPFFRDLLLVSQHARDAFIHVHGSSSSALVFEIITYDAIMAGRLEKAPLRCELVGSERVFLRLEEE